LRGGLQLARQGARVRTLARCLKEVTREIVIRPEPRERLYRRQLLEAAIYGDVFAHLLAGYHPEFSAILFYVIDSFSHQYWKYRQPELFDGVTETDVRKYGQVIDAAYLEVDKALGVILQALPRDALVIVVSDHGQRAGPILDRPYLMSERLLKRVGFHKRAYMTHLGYKTVFQPQSANGQDATLGELRQALDRIQLAQDKRPVFQVHAQSPRELEVTVCLDLSTSLRAKVLLPDGEEVELGTIVFSRSVSGEHDEQGVLIMRGPGVRLGHQVEGATILDVTPSVLALRGAPVGRDMDGQVILGAIEPGFLEKNPVSYVESYDTTEERDAEGAAFSDEEREQLEARLRKLGYLS